MLRVLVGGVTYVTLCSCCAVDRYVRKSLSRHNVKNTKYIEKWCVAHISYRPSNINIRMMMNAEFNATKD